MLKIEQPEKKKVCKKTHGLKSHLKRDLEKIEEVPNDDEVYNFNKEYNSFIHQKNSALMKRKSFLDK